MAHKQARIYILQSSLTSYFFPWRWDCCEYQRLPPEYNASLKPREMTFRIILHRCLTKISSSIRLEGENRLSFSSVLKFNSDFFSPHLEIIWLRCLITVVSCIMFEFEFVNCVQPKAIKVGRMEWDGNLRAGVFCLAYFLVFRQFCTTRWRLYWLLDFCGYHLR